MSGKVIKVLTNIRFRRSASNPFQREGSTYSEIIDIEYEERAAIIEFMGNIPRPEAEALAKKCLWNMMMSQAKNDERTDEGDIPPRNGELFGDFKDQDLAQAQPAMCGH